MADEAIGTDAAGYEVLTEAMLELANEFPGLEDGESVKFEELGRESGIALSGSSGALVYQEREDIVGGVHQTCRYAFVLVYRAGASAREGQKRAVSEFLDAFGKWLCRETAVIAGESYTLSAWPDLSTGREIKRITRENAYGTEPQESGVQDWVLPVTVEYTNEFSR
ncbi:MAG: hypothetical protein LIO51_01600 [Clostridiales bacterium]|nr:hypothetical protein [Clostridiales bacterium]